MALPLSSPCFVNGLAGCHRYARSLTPGLPESAGGAPPMWMLISEKSHPDTQSPACVYVRAWHSRCARCAVHSLLDIFVACQPFALLWTGLGGVHIPHTAPQSLSPVRGPAGRGRGARGGGGGKRAGGDKKKNFFFLTKKQKKKKKKN